MELSEFFISLGLTDVNHQKKALAVFIDEYCSLARVKERSKLDGSTNTIRFLTERLSAKFMGLSNTDTVSYSKYARRLLLRDKEVYEKIQKMVSTEGARGFNRVNDYARIAAHVYGDRKDSILSKPWIFLGNKYYNLQLDHKKSGLQAALYYKEGINPQYVYAIAGTRGANLKDWEANKKQLIGLSEQYDRACANAEKLSSILGTSRLVMVGHSKGGGQAAYCALRTGCAAITFNPAGLGLYKFKHNRNIKPKINSYVMVKDPLNLLQMLAQLMSVDITADGSVHYLENDKNSKVREWHGIDGFLRLGGMTDMQYCSYNLAEIP